MNAEQVRESIVVADCGRTLTRATLVEFVEGACRFIAQGTSASTIEPPYDDLGVGLRAALESLEAASRRRFADRTRIIIPQEDSGDGTDALLATVAATPPLRVGILATGGDGILNALLPIVRRSPVTALPTLSVEPTAPIDAATSATVATLARLQPDLLLIVAATDDQRGLQRLLGLATEIVGTSPQRETETPPAVLVIASEVGRDAATSTFSDGYEFGFLATNEYDPTDIALTVETEILELNTRRAAATLPGFDSLEWMVAAPPLARARAIDLVNRYMALQFDCAVVTVDLDEGFTCCWAHGGEGRALSEPALDLALGATNLLTALPLPDVIRWLPFSLSEDTLRGWILNRAVRPFTVPMTTRDRQIEAALTRELLRTGATQLAGDGPGALTAELLVGGSFFARWPDPTEPFMALIDGLDPRPASGIAQIALDRDALMPLIGALGTLEPDRAAELFEHDSLFDLGACVVVDCPANEQVQGELVYQDGRRRNFEVRGGEVLRLPLRGGERAATLHFAPGKRARIGNGGAGAGATFEGELAPHGGPVGLVIDARERPFAFPRNEQERIARVGSWLTAFQTVSRATGGDEQRPGEDRAEGTPAPTDPA
ncbi:MAG: hypothetical protein AVDCRST_MAG18-3688 [uncultured Thermomicrobiales bacterium]|uniref:Uncharacterized protein n=1 Tax=uncultured Thermomicrobiales bacterium TaxID=1645740 RepID=A0A6J4VU27_9BACT|nr:MAG: hypothetical protein AVDCRST_MAG18-3688 [uncultured Thermomicrobiales bacterium]